MCSLNPHHYIPLCVIMYLWVIPVFVFVGHTCICICGSYLCLLERFIPSNFASHSHLCWVDVVERNNISANVVRKRILVVGLRLKWNGELSTRLFLVLDLCLWTSLSFYKFLMLSFWDICLYFVNIWSLCSHYFISVVPNVPIFLEQN